MCCPDRCHRAPFFNWMWFVCDPCGITCIVFVYGLMFYASIALEFVIFPAWLGLDNPYLVPNEVAFGIIAFLMTFSHFKAMTTDPGTLAVYSREKLPSFGFGVKGGGGSSRQGEEESENGGVKKRQTSVTSTSTSKRTTFAIGGDTYDVSDPEGLQFSETLQQLVPRKAKVCKRCVNLKPSRVHHCSACNRCVMKMDHHCPWVNNCVGLFNQRYFLQFLIYIGVGSLYALVVVIWTAVDCLGAKRKQHADAVMMGGGMGVCGGVNTAMAVMSVLLLLESIIFGLFVTIMFFDQISAIWSDTTGIEQLKEEGNKSGGGGGEEEDGEGGEGKNTSLWSNLREVMGEPLSWRWFIPVPIPNEKKTREKLLNLFDAADTEEGKL